MDSVGLLQAVELLLGAAGGDNFVGAHQLRVEQAFDQCLAHVSRTDDADDVVVLHG